MKRKINKANKNMDDMFSNQLVEKIDIDPSKILVAQYHTTGEHFDSVGTMEYAEIASEINRRYCEEKGYSYYVENDNDMIEAALKNPDYFWPESKIQPRGIHPTWYKPLFVLELFKKYPDIEYLVFMDADCIFYNQSVRLESIIDPEKCFIFTQDGGSHSRVNAGFFILKNDIATTRLLTLWLYSIHFVGVEETSEHLMIDSGCDCFVCKTIKKTKEELASGWNPYDGLFNYPEDMAMARNLWHDQSCLSVVFRKSPYLISNLKVIHQYAFPGLNLPTLEITVNSKKGDKLEWPMFILHAYGQDKVPYMQKRYKELYGHAWSTFKKKQKNNP